MTNTLNLYLQVSSGMGTYVSRAHIRRGHHLIFVTITKMKKSMKKKKKKKKEKKEGGEGNKDKI